MTNLNLKRHAFTRPTSFLHVIVLTYRPVDEYGNFTREDEPIIAKQRHDPVSNERVHFDSKTLTFFAREVGSRSGYIR
jgi:hypothetical protein